MKASWLSVTSTVCLLSAFHIDCARHFKVEGMVVTVEPDRRTMVVSHLEIPGYMPAMVMPFHLKNASELGSLQPGTRVDFQLVVGGKSRFARKVRVQQSSTDNLKILPSISSERLAIGEPVPDFRLTNQLGRPVKLSDFQGRIAVVSFVYTRCPLTEVCPLLCANFARLTKRFQRELGSQLVFMSITLDPGHDSIEVLANYAKLWKADPQAWLFLTGGEADIEKVAHRFGVIYWPEEGALTHNSQTAIIGTDGRLSAIVEGSSYDVKQLGDLIAHHLETNL